LDDDPRGPVTNEDYVDALVRFDGGAQGTLEACQVITGSQCDLAFEVHGTTGALGWTRRRLPGSRRRSPRRGTRMAGCRSRLSERSQTAARQAAHRPAIVR
jgi:predicted dehydrogenase